MKPQFNIQQHLKPLRNNVRPLPLDRKQLATDYSYQTASADLRSANRKLNLVPHLAPSFRDLSAEFFKGESTRAYAIEAALFAIIVGVSAWPIFTMVRAMAQLLR
jgi:hypothetical protein